MWIKENLALKKKLFELNSALLLKVLIDEILLNDHPWQAKILTTALSLSILVIIQKPLLRIVAMKIKNQNIFSSFFLIYMW